MSDEIVTVRMDSLAEFQRTMKALPDVFRDRILRGAVATGASVVRKQAILNAPEFEGPVSKGHPPPGTLKKAIYQYRLVIECKPGHEVVIVSVRHGRTAKVMRRGKVVASVDAYYASWVELGHFTRTPGLTATQHRKARIAGTAASLGAKWVPPNPFMRKAFMSHRDAALRAMQDYATTRLPIALQVADTHGLLKFKP